MNFNGKVLLTGAGFSSDFGGFLASEMWSKIFNSKSLLGFPRVKQLLRNNYDFEFVYWLVTKGVDFSLEEKNALKVAIVQSYENMDSNITHYLNEANLGYFFNFLASGAGVSSHFTLNQDLLMERVFRRQPLGLATLKYKDYLDKIQSGMIDSSISVNLPGDSFINEFKANHLDSIGDLIYVKLHGSSGWLSSTGSDVIVIGNDKPKDITAEPLLRWYFDLFTEAINVKNSKILIIGYSFRDKHINKELERAVKNSGLRIYILSPESPMDIKLRLNVTLPGENSDMFDFRAIWGAVEGYFPYRVKDVFPSDGSTTVSQQDLYRIF